MTQNTRTSITDAPKKATDKDNFGIEPFENGLIRFIESTSTPITIALQGEWGSGKTSLMNSLRKKLCDDDGKKFYPIWLNTWQFSLMKEPEHALISIIKGLTEEVLSVGNEKNSKLQDAAKDLTKIFGKVFAATTKIAVRATTGQDISEVINAFSKENKETTILQLREGLNKTINLIISDAEKPMDGFIFFIDDLDRIDPPVAVKILELLKNIFDLDNCVFILAIDYDVVVKGLEPKFGVLTDKNEREFRSFFDKIIQLPFSMPVTKYKIDEFLKDSLISIGYLKKDHSEKEELLEKFSEIANLSVSRNPRSLKRLMNSLSLIRCINKEKESKENEDQLNEDIELLVNFALVSIQIAYPPIYRFLNKNPEFDKWDNTAAIQMNLKELDQQSMEKLSKSEEFDEEWEQVLFRLCENDHYLKKKALNISRLLNLLKVYIESHKENTGNIIEAIISLSSVTNVEADDKPEINYHKGNFLKNIQARLLDPLKANFPDIAEKIVARKAKVISNAFINFDGANNWGPWVKFRTYQSEGQIWLVISTEIWFNTANNKDLKKCITDAGIIDEFNKIETDYNSTFKKHIGIKAHNLCDNITKNYKHLVIHMDVSIGLDQVELFYKDEQLTRISNVIVEMDNFWQRLRELTVIVGEFYTVK